MWVLPAEAEATGFPHARSVVRSFTEPLEEDSERQPELRHWISSLEAGPTNPWRFAQLVRGQWNIENGSHRQRDVLWREDHQRMKHHGRAHVLASLRQVALWLHSTAVPRGLGKFAHAAPATRTTPISHQAKRFSHHPQSAFPFILNDPRE